MSNNFNDIISVLDAINKENTVQVYLPSHKKEVAFKSLTTGQQKLFLKSAIDNPVFQTRFIFAVHSVITENCIDKQVLPKLTVFDSVAILVQLRLKVHGELLEVTSENEAYKVNLNHVIEKIKSVELPAADTIIDAPFSIDVGIPSFTDQFALEKQLREKALTDDQALNSNINDTLGEAFIGEVSKYIKEVRVTANGTEHNLNYSSLNFVKKHQVLEKIPSTVVKKIIAYIEKVTSLQKSLTTVQGAKTTDNTLKDVEIPISSTLFAIE